MLTPFREDGSLDEAALRELVDFYGSSGSHGLLATCYSSETEFLSWEELLRIVRISIDQAAGLPVAATPHAGVGQLPPLEDRIPALLDLGVHSVVLVAARLCDEGAPEDALVERFESLPGDRLGIYESPQPYHRILSAQALGRVAATGRALFHKDTSCDAGAIQEKIGAVKGTNLLFSNAHAPTLLESLRAGGGGYCGVGANFYPELYAELCSAAFSEPVRAQVIQEFLTAVEPDVPISGYPAGAKAFLRRRGLSLGMTMRMPVPFGPDQQTALDRIWRRWREFEFGGLAVETS